MGSLTYRIDSGFLDDVYGGRTITQRIRSNNYGMELAFADPIIDPATVQMVKDHYNINHDDDDEQIRRNIKTAFKSIENYTNRTIVQRQLTLRYKRYQPIVDLLRPPHVSITSVKTIDDDNTTKTTLTKDTDYREYGDERKTIELFTDLDQQLEIIYQAGYGKNLDDIPSWAQDAVVFQLGVFYSNFDESMGTTVYDRGERMDERAISACKGNINYAED